MEAASFFLNERRPQQVKWLIDGQLPLSKLTLLVGDPDSGKSFVALDWAARVTRGLDNPDSPNQNASHGNRVLLLCADDDLDDTILPRLIDAGADLSNVAWWPPVVNDKDDGTRLVSLITDLPKITRKLKNRGQFRLVIIDPITAFMGRTHLNDTLRVRSILLGLGEAARGLGMAVVAVLHNRKAAATRAVYRAAGSHSFGAAARQVLTVVDDPAESGRRLLVPIKHNLQAEAAGRAFRIVEGRVEWSAERLDYTADEQIELTRRGMLTGDRVTEAGEWLESLLAGGRRAAADVQALARERRIPKSVLWTAKRERGVRAVRDGDEQRWFWELPVREEDEDWVGMLLGTRS